MVKIYVYAVGIILMVSIIAALFYFDIRNAQNNTTTQSYPSQAPINSLTGKKVNIVSIAYFPVQNNRLDTTVVNNNWQEYNFSLVQVRNRVHDLNQGIESTLEQGSAYKKYKNFASQPYLDYKIIQETQHIESMPKSQKPHPYTKGTYVTDYRKILTDHEICKLVDSENVREIWLWGYTGIDRAGFESNFSSSVGDISNSDRDPNDLPKCQGSYTVYEYNYGRGVPEAVEDHLHQFEAIFRFLNEDLFWNKYVGYFPQGNWNQANSGEQKRRCGWTHFPPNGSHDYDWENKVKVRSDCMDWQPFGGIETEINCDVWKCNPRDYFVFWMQNIPGENNGLSYQGKEIRNWWAFISDFDQSILAAQNLVY